jgi:hypothetical protein
VLVASYVTTLHPVMPVFDQWTLPELFVKANEGELVMADLFEWANGTHRMPFPRLVFLGLAFSSGWSMTLELLFNVMLVAGQLGMIIGVRKLAAGANSSGRSDFMLHLLVASTLFSFSQYWNWQWGFAIAIFMVNFFVCAAMLTLVVARRRGSGLWIVAAGACCFIASFSMAAGLLSWWAFLPLVVGTSTNASREKARIGGWIASALVTWGLYFSRGFGDGPDTSPLDMVMQYPLELVGYYLVLLGGPWSMGLGLLVWPKVSLLALAGALVALLFGLLAADTLLRRDAEMRERALPWLCLGAFGLLYCAANVAGRGNPHWLNMALDTGAPPIWLSMYTTPASLLTVATIQLAWLHQMDPAGARPKVQSVLAGAALVLLVVNLAASVAVVAERTPQLRRTMRKHALCLELRPHLVPRNSCGLQARRNHLVALLQALDFRESADDLEFAVAGERALGSLDVPIWKKDGAVLQVAGVVGPRALEGDRRAVIVTAAPDGAVVAVATIDRGDADPRWTIDLADPRAHKSLSRIWAWMYDPKTHIAEPMGEPRDIPAKELGPR